MIFILIMEFVRLRQGIILKVVKYVSDFQNGYFCLMILPSMTLNYTNFSFRIMCHMSLEKMPQTRKGTNKERNVREILNLKGLYTGIFFELMQMINFLFQIRKYY